MKPPRQLISLSSYGNKYHIILGFAFDKCIKKKNSWKRYKLTWIGDSMWLGAAVRLDICQISQTGQNQITEANIQDHPTTILTNRELSPRHAPSKRYPLRILGRQLSSSTLTYSTITHENNKFSTLPLCFCDSYYVDPRDLSLSFSLFYTLEVKFPRE